MRFDVITVGSSTVDVFVSTNVETIGKKRNHKVRSVIDQMRRTNKIRRVGPSTWEKI